MDIIKCLLHRAKDIVFVAEHTVDIFCTLPAYCPNVKVRKGFPHIPKALRCAKRKASCHNANVVEESMKPEHFWVFSVEQSQHGIVICKLRSILGIVFIALLPSLAQRLDVMQQHII